MFSTLLDLKINAQRYSLLRASLDNWTPSECPDREWLLQMYLLLKMYVLSTPLSLGTSSPTAGAGGAASGDSTAAASSTHFAPFAGDTNAVFESFRSFAVRTHKASAAATGLSVKESSSDSSQHLQASSLVGFLASLAAANFSDPSEVLLPPIDPTAALSEVKIESDHNYKVVS